MASEYFSTNMENGPQVKEALDKINKFYPELFSWIEINDTEIIDLKSNEIIVRLDDGSNISAQIYDTTNSIISFENLGVKDTDNIYWPRLAYGENILKFTGDATFEIVYREPRKVGAFA